MIYAIGDIHGHLDALQRIIDRVRADAGANGIERPKTVFLGDYVDRGPDSKGVLDLLSSPEIKRSLDPVFLMGNHDRAMLAVLRGSNPEAWFDEGGFKTMQSYVRWHGHLLDPSWHRSFIDTFPSNHTNFLTRLPTSHHFGPWLFSHAGIDPHRPLAEQPTATLIYGHRDFRDWPQPFADGVRVVHGHWRERGDRVAVLPHRIGVDTGCGFTGGHLSAVALDDDGVGVRVLSDAGGSR